ncbi:MAG: preprotein translocase subunit SecE [Bacteroidales bacterium]|jgi:preprotein translocase subunit SecE|nr:preprotein translocase subunit SecE [Bacteroidales bacterium]
MKKVLNYFKETYEELVHKVTWPSMKDLQNSVIVVSIASLIITFVVFLMDIILNVSVHFLFPKII